VAQQLPDKVRTRIVIDVVDAQHLRNLRVAQVGLHGQGFTG
jgi:hypothetical protein